MDRKTLGVSKQISDKHWLFPTLPGQDASGTSSVCQGAWSGADYETGSGGLGLSF